MLDGISETDLAEDVIPDVRCRGRILGKDFGGISVPKRRKTEEEVCHDGKPSENVDFVENGADEASTSAVATVSLEGKGKTNVVRGLKVTKQRAVQFLSYEQLVFLALKNANFSSLTIGQVYGFIESTFSCFHSNDTYWKANVERAVTVGKITKHFYTNLTPRSMDVVSATVKMREDKIGVMERKVYEWMTQFGEHNIEESRFSSVEEMHLVCQGAMGFLPPAAGSTDSSEHSEGEKSPSSDEDNKDFEADLPVCSQRNWQSWAPRKFPCRNCGLGNRALRQHLRMVHGLSEKQIDEYKAKLKKRKKKGTRYIGVNCPKCRAYISVKYLKLHLWNMHGMSEDKIAMHREKIAKMHMEGMGAMWQQRPKKKAADSSDEGERSAPEGDERIGKVDEEERMVVMRELFGEKEDDLMALGGQSALLGDVWNELFPSLTANEGLTDIGNGTEGGEWPDVVVKEEPVDLPDNEIPSPPSFDPPFCQPSSSDYQAHVIPPEGINVLALLEEDPFIPVDKQEEDDVKPDKEALDAEMGLGVVRKSKTYILPQNVFRPPPGHCMVCSKRVGRKALSRHLRLQHGFSEEDVLQYMLSDEERRLSCPGCTRLFKSQLSLRQHNRWCPPPAGEPEDVKPDPQALLFSQ